MAPTTAPNVFWTASPTFLAIRVPPSSSKAASNNSVTREDAMKKEKGPLQRDEKVPYRLGSPCCGSRRRTPARGPGPSPAPGPAATWRSRNRRTPPRTHGSGAWCRWLGTLRHICGISEAHAHPSSETPTPDPVTLQPLGRGGRLRTRMRELGVQ